MKYLIMSEGPNKKAIIDILLQDEHYLVEIIYIIFDYPYNYCTFKHFEV